MDYAAFYTVLLFTECRSIKKISLKAVTDKGNRVELAVQYLSIPKIFFANHGKRKFDEPLSKTTSFNVYASPQKKPKYVSVQRGIYLLTSRTHYFGYYCFYCR
jgi:hypothetical protein